MAAVAGPEFTAALLARAAGRPAEAVRDLLGEAVRAQVVAAPAEPLAPWRFAHDLFREVLEAEIDEAGRWHDPARAERAALERDALVAELAAATGLGGRPRRLGDQSERARKTVTARIRDVLDRVERAHPALGAHLRASVTTGTWCSYSPPTPTAWEL